MPEAQTLRGAGIPRLRCSVRRDTGGNTTHRPVDARTAVRADAPQHGNAQAWVRRPGRDGWTETLKANGRQLLLPQTIDMEKSGHLALPFAQAVAGARKGLAA